MKRNFCQQIGGFSKKECEDMYKECYTKKCKGDKMLAEVKYVAWRLDEMKISTIIPFGGMIFSVIPLI